MQNKILLSIKNLKKNFGENTVLKNISLDVKEGEVIAVIGPSGCGKSTFLRCINGLEFIYDGSIYLYDECISDGSISGKYVRQRIGMIFQSYDLFNHMKVLQNIMLAPVEVQKRDAKEVKRQALELLERVHLSDKADAWPSQLSGGQKQRIAIIRALIMNPKLVLMDEITASLDPETVSEVLQFVTELAKSGMTMIIVTHELSFAKAVADRILFFDKGLISEEGTPDKIFNHPDKERTKQFLTSGF